MGRLAGVADTWLCVGGRGEPSAFPLLVFHGGPGLDHTEFGGYLGPLTEGGRYRLVLADERACGRSDRTAPHGTWTLGRMAQDVSDLAASLGVRGGYATLGHSYGAFVVLQHAVDHPGQPRGTVVSSGLAAARWLTGGGRQLAAFEPAQLRGQVTLSWARETEVRTGDERPRCWPASGRFTSGARLLHRAGDGDDIVAQLAAGEAAFRVAAAGPDAGRFSPQAIGGATSRTLLVTDDPGAVAQRAVEAGATEKSPPRDDHGWRLDQIVDPFGHEREIGKPIRPRPPDLTTAD